MAYLKPRRIITRYALQDADGAYYCVCHQDDDETPVVGSTLSRLLAELADAEDVSQVTLLERIEGDLFTDQFEKHWLIVREEVSVWDLSVDDRHSLSRAAAQIRRDHVNWEKSGASAKQH